MKGNKMIDAKIAKFEDEQNNLECFRLLVVVIGLLAGASCYGIGNLMKAILPQLQLTFGLFGAYFPAIGALSGFHKSDLLDEKIKRVRHLKKIKKEGIKKNDSYDTKRYYKIVELDELKEKLNNSITRYGLLKIGGTAGWFLGTLCSIIVPGAMWFSLAGVVAYFLAGIKFNSIQKEMAQYQTRIDNLSDDLFFGPGYGYDPDKSDSTERFHSSKYAGRDVAKTIVNPEYQRNIEDYVEKLGNAEEVVLPNQKVKK